MFLGSLGSFVEPYIRHYEDVIKTGIKTRIVYDQNDTNAQQRLNNILNLKKEYNQNIEIKGNPTINATSRKFIYDTMAIDSMKLVIGKRSIDFRDLFKPKKGDLYYISTIYLDPDAIDYIESGFENVWSMLGPCLEL
jgi:hypothetical protein